MFKEDFERLLGRELSQEDYKAYSSLSHAAPEMSSEQFCFDVPELNPTLRQIADNIDVLMGALSHRIDEFEKLGEFIADMANEYLDSDLREKAIEIMGEKEYIAYMIENDLALQPEDLKLVLKLIS